MLECSFYASGIRLGFAFGLKAIAIAEAVAENPGIGVLPKSVDFRIFPDRLV
jgi:ABC-type nitrate/sulfonate/bicarbonate transport system permease component